MMEFHIDHHKELGNVHRFGKRRNGSATPIVGKFLYNEDRDLVKSRGYMLLNTPYGIQKQLPPDRNIRRKQLLHLMHQLRKQGDRSKLVRTNLS
jgi:hypothetical protein